MKASIFFIELFLAVGVFIAGANAMPASPDAYTITQPDGSQFEAYTWGDEFFNFEETEDGYVIGKALQGYYTYLDEEGNPSGYYVRSPENRTETEQVFLSKLNRQNVVNALREKTPAMQMDPYEVPEFAKKTKFYAYGPQALPAINNLVKKDSITGLVVLVQFSDVKFKNDDSRALYDEYMNAEGTYSKYFNMGSVRKYFKDNSMGTFRPHFDVAGPITLDSSRNYYGPNSPLASGSSSPKYEGARTAFKQAMEALKKQGGIDFSKYDNDGDGSIDFIFFIYAGVGSNNSGVADAIWPHAWSFYPSIQMSSYIRASRYACANEIDGKAYKSNNSTGVIGGIGTFVHEFSHVLGLPDLYDLNNTNVTKTLGSWSVMDQGNYNCPTNSDMVSNCAPPFYSSFEKMSLGWISPTELTARGEVRLDRVDSNYAYRVTHPTKSDEFFLLEYRTHRSWDVAQVKSGMLIYHVDYVASAWTNKKINTVGSGEHQHVDLIEAVPTTAHSTTSRDPFPGSSKVTSFDGFTFYDGTNAGFSLTDIKESSDTTYVTFTIPGSSSSSSVASSSSAKSSSSSAKSSSSIQSSSSAKSSSSSVKSSSSSVKSSSSSAKSSSSVTSGSTDCIAFVNGTGGYGSHCYNSGLNGMASGACYTMNPARTDNPQWINDNANDTYWWVKVSCGVSSSSSAKSSSSSVKSSSSSAKSSSSSVKSSSSSAKSSSSSVKSSSSSAKSSSSSVKSSSSSAKSSSSSVKSSSSSAKSSSSSVKSSSSSMDVVSSAVESAGSSEDEEYSSSYEDSSSSSAFEPETSSSFVTALRDVDLRGLSMVVSKSTVSVFVPQSGTKRIVFFSMTGNILHQESFTENNFSMQIPRSLLNVPCIISLERNGRILMTRRK